MRAFSQTEAERVAEARLVARAVQGDAEAFGDLYERYLSSIYRYVYTRVGHATESEDLTETVFLKAWEALDRYQPAELQFRALLYRIAHNLVIDHHRKRKDEYLPAGSSGWATPDRGPETAVISQEHLSRVLSAVQQLDPLKQQVLTLRFIGGLSHTETAQLLNKSTKAVRMLQCRALATLRAVLEKGSDHER
jgi:RNA polymerase sigma-70 factor (ECF subfamily)